MSLSPAKKEADEQFIKSQLIAMSIAEDTVLRAEQAEDRMEKSESAKQEPLLQRD